MVVVEHDCVLARSELGFVDEELSSLNIKTWRYDVRMSIVSELAEAVLGTKS
jgi:hypothetical protein